MPASGGRQVNWATCHELAEDAAQTTLMVVEFQRWYRGGGRGFRSDWSRNTTPRYRLAQTTETEMQLVALMGFTFRPWRWAAADGDTATADQPAGLAERRTRTASRGLWWWKGAAMAGSAAGDRNHSSFWRTGSLHPITSARFTDVKSLTQGPG